MEKHASKPDAETGDSPTGTNSRLNQHRVSTEDLHELLSRCRHFPYHRCRGAVTLCLPLPRPQTQTWQPSASVLCIHPLHATIQTPSQSESSWQTWRQNLRSDASSDSCSAHSSTLLSTSASKRPIGRRQSVQLWAGRTPHPQP